MPRTNNEPAFRRQVQRAIAIEDHAEQVAEEVASAHDARMYARMEQQLALMQEHCERLERFREVLLEHMRVLGEAREDQTGRIRRRIHLQPPPPIEKDDDLGPAPLDRPPERLLRYAILQQISARLDEGESIAEISFGFGLPAVFLERELGAYRAWLRVAS